MAANIFSEERRVPALLTIVYRPAYKVIQSLLAPSLPQSQSYATLKATLKQHYMLLSLALVIAERFHFHCRDQKQGEMIAE